MDCIEDKIEKMLKQTSETNDKEENINRLNDKYEKNSSIRYKNIKLGRWISLKIIDGNEKILKEIEKNLNISIINNSYLSESKKEIVDIINANGIKQEDLKDKMISSIIFMSENVCKDAVQLENKDYNRRDRKIDKVLTSKIWGIPIMLLFLGVIFWLTIAGANYPSELLSQFFGWLQEKIVYVFEMFGAPDWLKGVLIDGVYKTLTWIIAVMLPPMAIFFPLFTLLEDLGFLPRIAFNLDKFFRKAGSSRKASSYNVHGIWL